MNSVGAVIAWLAGCTLGLLVIGAHPEGLEPRYGLALLALASCAAVPLWLGWGKREARWAAILAVAVLMGCGRTLLVSPPITAVDLSYYNAGEKGSPVQVTGEVSAEPVYADRYQRLRITADSLLPTGASQPTHISGDMLTILPRYPEFNVGDHLRLTGRLTAPPSSPDFDYAGYLAHHGVFSYMLYPKVARLPGENATGAAGMISSARQRVRAAITSSLPEPQASLTVGVVTGDRTSMPQDVLDDFNRSGTTHILAISGQNMSLLVGFIYIFFGGGRTRRRMPLWLLLTVLGLIAIYTLFTGATPSVVRAAIMSAVLLLSQAVGRRFDPVSALVVSAGVMTLADPNLLLDGGFLLSFAAMAGLAQVSPFVYRWLESMRVPAIISLPLAAGLGAQAATAPLIMLLTGRLSLVSPFASLTTEFALLPLMIAGIAAGVLGAIVPPLATVLGILCWPSASWMLASVHWWAALPLASFDVAQVSTWWVLLYYALLAMLVWWGREGRRSGFTWHYLALAAGGLTAWALFASLAFG